MNRLFRRYALAGAALLMSFASPQAQDFPSMEELGFKPE
jgi:hypothetical protein